MLLALREASTSLLAEAIALDDRLEMAGICRIFAVDFAGLELLMEYGFLDQVWLWLVAAPLSLIDIMPNC